MKLGHHADAFAEALGGDGLDPGKLGRGGAQPLGRDVCGASRRCDHGVLPGALLQCTADHPPTANFGCQARSPPPCRRPGALARVGACDPGAAMSDVFISYARSTEAQAERIGEALVALGYGVWRDDALPPHRAYGEVIEERLKAAKAVV